MVSGIDIVSLDRVAAEDELLGYSVETVVRNATLRVLMELPYLSPAVHHLAVEGLVRGLLTRLGAREEEEIAVDPLKVAMLVSEEIDRRYRSLPVRFELMETPRMAQPGAFEWRVREDVEAPIAISSITDWE